MKALLRRYFFRGFWEKALNGTLELRHLWTSFRLTPPSCFEINLELMVLWGSSVMASEWSNTFKTCSRSLKASTLRRSLVCSKYVVQFFSIALWRRSLLIAILLKSERMKRSRGMHFINVVRLKRNLKYEWKLWAEHVCANLADWLIRLSNHVCEGTWLDASARHGAQTLTNEICSDFEKSIHFSFDTTYSHRKQEAHDLF